MVEITSIIAFLTWAKDFIFGALGFAVPYFMYQIRKKDKEKDNIMVKLQSLDERLDEKNTEIALLKKDVENANAKSTDIVINYKDRFRKVDEQFEALKVKVDDGFKDTNKKIEDGLNRIYDKLEKK